MQIEDSTSSLKLDDTDPGMRGIFLSNIDFDAATSEIERSLMVLWTPEPFIGFNIDHNKLKGTAIVTFKDETFRMSRALFERLSGGLEIRQQIVKVKEDFGHRRQATGQFMRTYALRCRSSNGGSYLSGTIVKPFHTKFLSQCGVLKEQMDHVLAGPYPPDCSVMELTSFFEKVGALKQGIKTYEYTVEGYRSLFAHVTYRYNLSAIQAICYLHGKFIKPYVLTPKVCFKGQSDPKILMKEGLGVDGAILNIDEQMETHGFVDIESVMDSVLKIGQSVLHDCKTCGMALKVIGLDANYECFFLNCNSCNTDRNLTKLTRLTSATNAPTVVHFAGPLDVYDSVQRYISVLGGFVDAEKNAERDILLGVHQSITICRWKTIEKLDDKFDILIFGKIPDCEAQFDLHRHRNIRVVSDGGFARTGNRDFSFSAWTRCAKLVHIIPSSKTPNGVILIAILIKDMQSETMHVNSPRIEPRFMSTNYDSLQRGLKMFEKEIESSNFCNFFLNPSHIAAKDMEVIHAFDNTLIFQHDLFLLLNQRQRLVMEEAMESKLYSLTGPPGTGKTFFVAIASLLMAILQRQNRSGRKIVVCSPSNTNADNIMAELLKFEHHSTNASFIRMLSKSAETLQKSYSFPTLHEQVKEMLLVDEEFRKLTSDSSVPLYELTRTSTTKLESLVSTYEQQILSDVDIIVCTLTAATDFRLNSYKIDTLIVDEAGQVMEASFISAFFCGHGIPERCLLVGDPNQLFPFISSEAAKSAGFCGSVMEKVKTAAHLFTKPRIENQLNLQYRMNPTLGEFTSSMFYGGTVFNDSSCSCLQLSFKTPTRTVLDSLEDKSIMFINADFEETPVGTSFANKSEADLIVTLLKALIEAQVEARDIGVISFYNAQTNLIRTKLKSVKQKNMHKIIVSNVDSFQGKQKDVILVSCVRANPRCQKGFLNSRNRVNVATSRSRRALILVGNAKTLIAEGGDIWAKIIKHIKTNCNFYEFENISLDWKYSP